MLYDHRRRGRLGLHNWQGKLRKIHVQSESNRQVSLDLLLERDEIGRITTVRPFGLCPSIADHPLFPRERFLLLTQTSLALPR